MIDFASELSAIRKPQAPLDIGQELQSIRQPNPPQPGPPSLFHRAYDAIANVAGLPSGQQIIGAVQHPVEQAKYLVSPTENETGQTFGSGFAKVYSDLTLGGGFHPAMGASMQTATTAVGREIGARIPAVGRALSRGVEPIDIGSELEAVRQPAVPEGKALVGKPAFDVKEPSPLQNIGTRLAAEEGTANIPETIGALSDNGKAAIQSLKQFDSPANAPETLVSPFRPLRQQALGRRDLFAHRSNIFWQDEVRPTLAAFAKASGEKNPTTLERAVAYHLDSLHDPVSAAENLAPALEKMPKLQSVLDRAANLTPEEQAYAQSQINTYDQARGLYRMDQGVQNEVIDYHVGHIWRRMDGTPLTETDVAKLTSVQAQGKMNPYSRFSQQRTIPTLLEGIAKGYVPATDNIVDINRYLDWDTARVVMAKNIRDSLVQSGEGQWAFSARDLPSGDWVNVGDRSRFFRNPVALPDPNPDATRWMAREQSLYVPQKVYDNLVKSFIEGDPLTQVGGPAKGIMKYFDVVKWGELLMTFYHDFNLGKMLLFSRPVEAIRAGVGSGSGFYGKMGLLEKGAQLISERNPTLEKAILNGLTLRTNLLDALPSIMEDTSGGIVQQFRDSALFKSRQHALWDVLHTRAKAVDMMMSFDNFAKRFESEINPATGALWTPDETIADIARGVNAKYGGLNWDLQGTTQGSKRIMRLLMFAPDWTISNLKFGAMAFEKGPAGAMARQSLARTSAVWFGLLEGINMLMNNGQTTFQNERGHQLHLKLPWKGPDGQAQYTDALAPGEFKDLLRVMQGLAVLAPGGERFGDPDELWRLAQSKASPLMRTLISQVGGVDYQGKKFYQPGMPTSDYLKERGSQLLQTAAPVPFPVSAAVDYATGKKTGVQVAFQAAGIGSVSKGTFANANVWNELPQEKKAEFLQTLDEAGKTEFSQSLARGRFTGTLAKQLRDFRDRYVYQRNQFDQEINRMLQSGDVQGAVQRFREEKRYHTDRQLLMRLLPYLATQPSQ